MSGTNINLSTTTMGAPITATSTVADTQDNELAVTPNDISTPKDKVAESPSPLVDFTCFMLLPGEVRSRVWMFALLAPQIHIIRPDGSSRSRTNAIVQTCREAQGEANRLGLDYYIIGSRGTCKNYVNLLEDTFWMPTEILPGLELHFESGGFAVEEGYCEEWDDDEQPPFRRLVLYLQNGNDFTKTDSMLVRYGEGYTAVEIFIAIESEEVDDILVDFEDVASEAELHDYPALEFNHSVCPDRTERLRWESLAEESMERLRHHRETMDEDAKVVMDEDGFVGSWPYVEREDRSWQCSDASLFLRTEVVPNGEEEVIHSDDYHHDVRWLSSGCYRILVKM